MALGNINPNTTPDLPPSEKTPDPEAGTIGTTNGEHEKEKASAPKPDGDASEHQTTTLTEVSKDGEEADRESTEASPTPILGQGESVEQTQPKNLTHDGTKHDERTAADADAKRPGEAIRKQRFGVLSLPELEKVCSQTSETYLVENLFPSSSVDIVVGDSGLGKSPFLYQMGLCVATGKPFLGLEVQQGGVLYLDFENGLSQINDLSKRLGHHLGLGSLPEEFRVWTYGSDGQPNLDEMVKVFKSKLVIVDSLRTYDPEAESKNPIAGKLIGVLHRIAKEHGCAIILVHHIRKPGQEKPPPLDTTSAVSWLNEACGARALINQTDVRLGIDLPEQGAGKADLVVKGFARLRGGIGPLYLARDYDDQGEPLGYRLRKGPDLLFNEGQEAAFARLPKEFGTRNAKEVYGRGDQATSDFLQKCVGVGILRKTGRGRWVKVSCNGAE